MNNLEFKQHFINALTELGISDYENIIIVIEPVYEKDKWTSQSRDEIMRLQILTKRRG